jgi:uncharacterized protein
MEDLRVSVAEVLGRPGEYRDVSVSGRLGEARTELATLVDRPIHAALRLESVVEGILVTGTVEGDTVLTCARCLKEIHSRASVEVTELFAPPGSDVEDEAYAISGAELDLAPMLRDALVLSLPLNPVCKSACSGICPQCGGDLSEGDHVHDEGLDPRWAELSALRAKLDG